ncbi:MAG: cellulose 1,4-beta-cellobiosidase, partial [Verrucomicrobiales bacterium]
LNADSKHAMVIMNPGGSVSFQRRATTAGGSGSTTVSSQPFPHWVRVVRNGDTLTGFHSANGTNWTQIGSVSIPMAQEVHIGLAVTSHNNGTLCEATFSNVTVTGQ